MLYVEMQRSEPSVTRFPWVPPGFGNPLHLNHLTDRTQGLPPQPVADGIRGRGRPLKLGHSVESRSAKQFSIQIEESDLQVLPVPNGFHHRFKGLIPHTVKLMTCCGCCWKVQLIRWQGIVVLGQGWRRFANMNQIRPLDIITFTLKEDMQLRVKFYCGMHSMEKKTKYPEDSCQSCDQVMFISIYINFCGHTCN